MNRFAITQKADFIFATFIKNLCKIALILPVYESIWYHHTKHRNITLYHFSPKPKYGGFLAFIPSLYFVKVD